ncbi:glycoside hydrolase family 2 protein [Bacteroides salyersiae]|nr:glycoside hydrolase family 2 TIM barrel-domain containing protein [Bacteroides salyersiae]
MKPIKLLFSVVSALAIVSCVGNTSYCSNQYLFNEGWSFFRVDSSIHLDESKLIEGDFPPQAESVTLPHTVRIEPLVVNNQWQGISYYSKSFQISKNDKNKSLFLKFEGAMTVADVWINGKHITTHVGGFLPFTINIDKAVKPDSNNILVVKLDNRDNPTTGPRPLKELDFNTYGGIYRNVWFIAKAPVHISDPIYANKEGGGGIYIKTKNVTKASALIDIKTNLVNNSTKAKEVKLIHTLLDEKDNEVWNQKSSSLISADTDKDIAVQTVVSEPKLWSPDTPYLYKVVTEVYSDGQLVDKEINSLGIRDINISANGLYLNGNKLFLRGVNRHQEYPYVGYALSDEAQYRDAYLIKKAGFDYVRASHYPHSPAFLKACDKLGLFVLDAILGWQYFGDSLFVEHAKTSARELIRRDRNHPCILAWELSINETPMPEDFMQEMNAIRTEEAPGTNTAGWIKDKYDIYIEARQHRKEVDFSVPLIVSEYGDWEYYAQNAGFNQNEWSNLLEEERNSRQSRESGEKRMLQQALNIQEAHNDNRSTHAFADGYWSMFDYNRGYADDIEYSGIMDICRLPKFSYFFFQSQRDIDVNNEFAQPMVKIASYWKPGESKYARIYSNCDEVELYLNNFLVGRKMPDVDYSTSNLNHPPFTFDVECTSPGKLKAFGYYKGKRVCSDSIRTPEKARKIKLLANTCGIALKNNDLMLIYAQIQDSNGSFVANATDVIDFIIEGDGIIINTKETKTIGGVALILLKTGNTHGEIIITAKSPKLKSGTIKFSI